ncbi:hypothetical protein QM565_30445 [Geitlerinema splendidum]|nr:hypothetical protein [Geitlerinema splendidum]
MAVRDYYTCNGRIIGEKRADEERSRDYICDPWGNVIAVYQADWQIAAITYDPWGEQLSNWNASSYRYLWGGGIGYRQTNKEWATHYVRARHYSFMDGTWTTIDPLWPQEPAYQYVGNRVTRSIDPSGKHPCDQRTKRYCSDAKKHYAYQNFGINCFCFVSDAMCKFIKTVPPTVVIGGVTIGRQTILRCVQWADCINKCLFDCYLNPDKCDPSSRACWLRTADPGLMNVPGHPCRELYSGGCPSHGMELEKDKCCRSMVFCEQERYGWCNSEKGPCSKLDNKDKKGPSCAAIFQAAAAQLGFDFPFTGNNAARQTAAYNLCCREKVWASKVGTEPFGRPGK